MAAAGFTEEYLASLSFPTGEEALEFLGGLALRHGFKLCRRDRVSSDYIRCYCSMADISMGKHKTKKRDCPFRLSLSLKEGDHGKLYHIQKVKLIHNHPLTRIEAVPMTDDIKKHVITMKKIGERPHMICDFIAATFGVTITTDDVAAVAVDLDQEICTSETDELERIVREKDGICEFYEMDGEFGNIRVGAFSQTLEEAENMRKYGDVIFLDGTEIDSTLRWDLFPVTLIDVNRQVVSGGIFHLGLQTAKVFEWVLSTIHAHCGDPNKWAVLFTDEDSALMVAIPHFCAEVHPIHPFICVWHKFNNIIKNIRALAIPTALKRRLESFVGPICHGTEAEVINSLEKALALAPELVYYFENNVRPRLRLFADCYKGSVLTLGYKATAPSESANNMIKGKLPDRRLSLAELRKHITAIYQAKKSYSETTPHLMSPLARQLKNEHDVCLAPNVASILDRSFKRAMDGRMRLEQSPEGILTCCEGKRTFMISPDHCECGDTISYGLPCRHLIFAHMRLHGLFPVFLINKRWLTHEPDHVSEPLVFECRTIDQWLRDFPSSDDDSSSYADSEVDPVCPTESWILQDLRKFREQDDHTDRDLYRDSDESSSDEVPFRGDDDQRFVESDADPPPLLSDDSGEEETPRKMNQSERFQRLNYLGKELSRIGSSEKLFGYVEGKMESLLQRLLAQGEGVKAGASDAPAVKKRGRRKRTGNSNCAPGKNVTCLLCGKGHDLAICQYRGLLDDAINTYQGDRNSEGRQCKVCHYRGHNRQGCPCLKSARDRLAESDR
jgi:hypothetical protein